MAEELTIITVGAPAERFDALVADHSKWRAVAQHLFLAAEKLWPDIEAGFAAQLKDLGGPSGADGLRLRGPFYVLVGLAFENFAKALIIRNKQCRREPITNGDVLGGNHDLVTLVRNAEIAVDEAEASMLVRLSRFVLWQGRYPVPRRSHQLDTDTITGAGDMRQIRKFLARLDDEYRRSLTATNSTSGQG